MSHCYTQTLIVFLSYKLFIWLCTPMYPLSSVHWGPQFEATLPWQLFVFSLSAKLPLVTVTLLGCNQEYHCKWNYLHQPTLSRFPIYFVNVNLRLAVQYISVAQTDTMFKIQGELSSDFGILSSNLLLYQHPASWCTRSSVRIRRDRLKRFEQNHFFSLSQTLILYNPSPLFWFSCHMSDFEPVELLVEWECIKYWLGRSGEEWRQRHWVYFQTYHPIIVLPRTYSWRKAI